ncbi:hypothetical protein Cch01nite_44600 [Cellulomonas chitinilytica]|uniref:Uncharacterized protein n=1 Tax=Cellulomonas chitinilytica TaxID=398759 RepID=A0A919U3Y1_9CELL|nr:hypothetical protein [Cellulomonas chitinilytica]GIG23736.1 hypothetical protein Cch01nite_44600 [Cellulomonas chitinilytica]
MQRSTLIRRSRRWLIAPLAMALLGMTAQSSLAASQPVSPDTRSHLEAFWNAHGVPKATQKSLLSKLAAGQTWDAVDGKHTPVSSSQATSNGSQETVDTYADGSIVVSDLEQPQTPPTAANGITPLSVAGCRTTVGGSGYANYDDCKASSDTGIVTLAFYISYSRTRATTAPARRSSARAAPTTGRPSAA